MAFHAQIPQDTLIPYVPGLFFPYTISLAMQCWYICMYVCMYVHMYACIHVCMYICMYVDLMNVCMYVVHNYTCFYSIPTKLLPTGPKPSARLVRTTDSSILVSCSVPPQLQFANILNEWKVTLQRVGFPRTSVTTLFTAPSTRLTVHHLLPATRYTVWVSVRAGSAEGPLSDGLNVTTQEGGESIDRSLNLV